MAPRPAGIGDQGVALDDDGVVDLHQLGRAVMGVAVIEADRRRHAVLVVLGPPAASGRPDRADEQRVLARVDAVHPPHHQIGVMAGRDAFGDGGRQRLEHRVHDGHREGHPAPHRRRALGADDPPGRDDRLQRAEAPVVDRVVGRRGDALEGDLGAGIGGGDAGVVEPLDLARDVGEVDGHLLARNLDADDDRDLLADIDPVVVHEGLGLVDAVGDRAGALARGPLGLIHDAPDRAQHRIPAVAFDQGEEAALAGANGGELGAEVAERAFRHADVHRDDVDQVAC